MKIKIGYCILGDYYFHIGFMLCHNPTILYFGFGFIEFYVLFKNKTVFDNILGRLKK